MIPMGLAKAVMVLGEYHDRPAADVDPLLRASGRGRRRDQLEEASRLQARPADEPSVDVLLRQQLRRVGRLHRAAVEDAHLLGDRLAEELGQGARG